MNPPEDLWENGFSSRREEGDLVLCQHYYCCTTVVNYNTAQPAPCPKHRPRTATQHKPSWYRLSEALVIFCTELAREDICWLFDAAGVIKTFCCCWQFGYYVVEVFNPTLGRAGSEHRQSVLPQLVQRTRFMRD